MHNYPRGMSRLVKVRSKGRFDFFYANAGFTVGCQDVYESFSHRHFKGYRDLYETTEALFAKSLQVMTVAPYLGKFLQPSALDDCADQWQ